VKTYPKHYDNHRLMSLSQALGCSLIFLFFSAFPFSQSMAQGSSPYGFQATPKHGWEVGVHGGHFFSSGDVDFNPGWAAGFHLRKALDYLFSLRIEGMYGMALGDSEGAGLLYQNKGTYSHETTYGSFMLHGVFSLNNLRWDKPLRKVNLYAFVGGGPVYTQTAITATDNSFTFDDVDAGFNPGSNISAGVELGAGIAFRVSEGFNIGVEHKGATLFGRRTDLIDGYNFRWRDILNYTNLRLNFNLRKKGELSEPLYWVNPLDVVLKEVSELKERPVVDLTDTDEDGVIDALDRDKNSPPGVPVDTRGRPLDSDDDGVPDYQDKEPYSPPNVAVDGEGMSQGNTFGTNLEDMMTKEEVQSMIQEALQGEGGRGTELIEWFLPMIHFDIDDHKVRYSDFGNLSNVANVLMRNPEVKLVVVGYTDSTASPEYNNVLSYKRAKAAIDHLVNNYAIERDRFFLQYSGEDNALVPANGSSFMNRRVEFKVADRSSSEMPPPPGVKVDDFSGNKDSKGY
jgi:OOP family OmpA-OmpF porin